MDTSRWARKIAELLMDSDPDETAIGLAGAGGNPGGGRRPKVLV